MPKKPVFKQLEESALTGGKPSKVSRNNARTARPKSGSKSKSAARPKNVPTANKPGDNSRSLEGRAIEALNKQIAALYKFIPSEDNNYLSPYHKAIDELGMETRERIVNGEKTPVIRNTSENRAKLDALRAILAKNKAKTMGDIRQQAKDELKREGLKRTESNIREKMYEIRSYNTLTTNLQFVYNQETQGNYTNSWAPDMLRGVSRRDDPIGYADRVKYISRQLSQKIQQGREEITAQIRINPDEVY